MPEICVCVPARNEVQALPKLLNALAKQSITGPIRVALCVNNSDDQTEAVAKMIADQHAGRLALHCETRVFDPALAHAGSARRAAMDLGADLLSKDNDVLISTDADCRPPSAWLESILARMDGDTLIGGRICLDEDEDLSPDFRKMRCRFDHYWAEVRAIEDRLDPVEWDPEPRHGDHTGASLALSLGLYRRAGGVPRLQTGEDRALVDAAIRVGGRLIHPDTVWTRTSARTVGRAAGGMAVDMQRLTRDLTEGRTPMVPAFHHWERRVAWRRETRARLLPGRTLSEFEQALEPMPCDMPLPEGQ